MNLLLLLSALISALTGVGGGTRAPQPATAVSVNVAKAASEAVQPASAATRPAITLPRLIHMAGQGCQVLVTRFAVEPLYASRRRE